MESLPTLQSLHDALISESNVDAEEELLSVMTHLLVCAIEDPGIPNPGRHTTLLGQSLRNADITNANLSEILRIYLYATATGEVRQLTNITLDREKDRRIPDHHQNDIDYNNSTSSKNQQYYELLHENETWKLSVCLKDKPFVALNPTKKAKILGHLCNDLLINKAVLKQIDGSLESSAQAKKEKYMMDMKIRKYKSMHIRKARTEAVEKAVFEREKELAAAAAAAKLLVEQQTEMDKPEESETNNNGDKIDTVVVSPTCDINFNQKDDIENEIPVNSIPQLLPPATASSAFEDSSTKNNIVDTPTKKIMEECTYQNGNASKTISRTVGDDAATDVGMDDDLSDVESELTNVEEDEDSRLSAEEIQKKLEKIIKSSIQCKESLEASSNQLRATCYGQDRFWRRYWKLPKAGGIFIEAMESAQNEIMDYNRVLEHKDLKQKEIAVKSEIKTELEINNDYTNDINSDNGPPAQMVHAAEDDEEDDARNDSGIEENDKIYDDVIVCDKSTNTKESNPSSSVLETIESVIRKDELEIVNSKKMQDQKWFSVLNRELPLTSNELQTESNDIQKQYSNVSCDMSIQIQGHRWDIANNAQYFTVPIDNCKADLNIKSESYLSFSGLDEKMIYNVLDSNECKEKEVDINKTGTKNLKKIQHFRGDSVYQGQCSVVPTNSLTSMKSGRVELKLDEATGISLQNIANMTLNNISAYLSCDIPTAIIMTPEEHKLIEKIKIEGFPKTLTNNYVKMNERYGWWKIDSLKILAELSESLNMKGVRERELKLNFNKVLIDVDEIDLSTPYPLNEENMDDGNYKLTLPDGINDWNPKISRRVELALLEQLEALEDKIASASMQVKHWVLPNRNENENYVLEDVFIDENTASLIPTIRERIASLEGAIERRYLKPPLGIQVGDMSLAVITQQQQQQSTQQPYIVLDSGLLNTSIGSGNGTSTADNSAAASPAISVCDDDRNIQEENIPKGLASWRDAVSRSHTTAQLAMALYVLESCVAWDKSIMKAVS